MMNEEHNAPVRVIIKKGRGHAGHHGGAWKVAYADFVTAMMALFIVLWIVGQSNQIKEAISAYFNDPGVFTSGRNGGILKDGQKTASLSPPGAGENGKQEMETLKIEAKNIEKAIGSLDDFARFKDKIQVTVTSEGLRIDLVEESEGLFFGIGKATINAETVHLLKVIASRLSALPNSVIVEGYTDARPYGSSGYSNWDLSTDRANSARKVLEENGLRKNQVLEVRGFADRKLRVPDKPFDFSNRRVSIVVKPQQEHKGPSGAGTKSSSRGRSLTKVATGQTE